MPDDDQGGHSKEEMTGHSLAELKVMLVDEQTVPYQVPVKTQMNTPAARIPAALAELKLRMKRGHLKVCTQAEEQGEDKPPDSVGGDNAAHRFQEAELGHDMASKKELILPDD